MTARIGRYSVGVGRKYSLTMRKESFDDSVDEDCVSTMTPGQCATFRSGINQCEGGCTQRVSSSIPHWACQVSHQSDTGHTDTLSSQIILSVLKFFNHNSKTTTLLHFKIWYLFIFLTRSFWYSSIRRPFSNQGKPRLLRTKYDRGV